MAQVIISEWLTKAAEYQSKTEILKAELESEAQTWAEKMLKNIKNSESSEGDKKFF